MKIRLKIGWILLLGGFFISSLMFYGCGSGENKAEDLESEVDETAQRENKNETSREVITELIGSFSTPVEMALMIKQGNFDFNTGFLLQTDSLERFSNNYSKAIAMGGYGANMGYINIYEKSLMAVEYLGAIRSLAKDLDLEHLFDFTKMLELAKKSSNIDSLITISTKNFNDMDIFLREKGRDELSVLMIFGTWLEGTNVTANLYLNDRDNEELKNRIAEQKVSFEKLIMIIEKAYPDDEFMKELTKELGLLGSLFRKIEIEYIYKEPIMKEVDGQLVIEDQSEMNISAEKEQVNLIADEIIRLRNSMLN